MRSERVFTTHLHSSQFWNLDIRHKYSPRQWSIWHCRDYVTGPSTDQYTRDLTVCLLIIMIKQERIYIGQDQTSTSRCLMSLVDMTTNYFVWSLIRERDRWVGRNTDLCFTTSNFWLSHQLQELRALLHISSQTGQAGPTCLSTLWRLSGPDGWIYRIFSVLIDVIGIPSDKKRKYWFNFWVKFAIQTGPGPALQVVQHKLYLIMKLPGEPATATRWHHSRVHRPGPTHPSSDCHHHSALITNNNINTVLAFSRHLYRTNPSQRLRG